MNLDGQPGRDLISSDYIVSMNGSKSNMLIGEVK